MIKQISISLILEKNFFMQEKIIINDIKLVRNYISNYVHSKTYHRPAPGKPKTLVGERKSL
jgi:hypothetical protein